MSIRLPYQLSPVEVEEVSPPAAVVPRNKRPAVAAGPADAILIAQKTIEIDLDQAGHSTEATALLLNVTGNGIRASLLLDTSTGKITTDGYAFIKLNQDDGFNPVTLFHTIHGNVIDQKAAIYFPQQTNRKLYLTVWKDTPAARVEMQRG